MNKKGGFDIQTFLITFLVVSGILVTMGSFAYQLSNDYSEISTVSVNGSFSSTYDKLDDITSKTDEIKGEFEAADVGDQDADSQFLGGALGAVKIITPTLSIAQAMIEDMAVTLHVPVIWVTIASTTIIILLITTFIFMIFKFRG